MATRSGGQTPPSLVGVPKTSHQLGASMVEGLVGQWPLPMGLTAGLLLFLGLVAWGSYGWPMANRARRQSELFRLGLACLRWLSLLMVLGMLGGWRWQSLQLAPPRLVLLLDDSASMANLPRADRLLGNDPSEPPRWGWPAVHQWLLADEARNLVSLSERYQLRIGLVGDSLRWLSEPYADPVRPPIETWVSNLERIVPERSASRLGEGIASAASQLQDHPPAAVVLISDGIVTDGLTLVESARLLARQTIPLWILQTSDPTPQLTIEVGRLLGPSHALLGDSVTFSASMRLPPSDGGWLDVKLIDRGDGQPLATQRLVLPTGGGDRTCQWRFTPQQAGDLRIGVELELLPSSGGSAADRSDNAKLDHAKLDGGDSPSAGSASHRQWLEPRGPTVEHRLRVRDQPLRVLLVQSAPSYEFRFLKSWLERGSGEPARQVPVTAPLSWLGQGAAGYARQDRTAIESLPSSREALGQFDVVVLGDVHPDELPLSFQPALRDFVQLDGGGLIVIAGPAAMPLQYADQPLAQLLPVRIEPDQRTAWPTPIGWQPTPLGLRLPPFQTAAEPPTPPADLHPPGWAGLPSQRWHQRPLMPRPAAHLLVHGVDAQTPGRSGQGGGQRRSLGPDAPPLPLVVSHYFGRGLVVYQASDETFQWTSDDVSQRYYDRYWGGMLRWLAQPGIDGRDPSPRWSIDPAQPQPSEPATVTAWLLPTTLERLGADLPRLALAALSGTDEVGLREVELLPSGEESGQFTVELPGLPRGDYLLRWEWPTVESPPDPLRWSVQPQDLEGSLRLADRSQLERATQLTGGRWLQLTAATRLSDQLPAGEPQPVGVGPATTLWNHPAVVGMLVLLLTVEWLGRRRCGLR